MVGKSTLGMVDRGASVQRVNDIVTNRVRVITYDIETFAKVDVLDDIVNHKGLGGKANGGEQPCFRSEYKEGGSHGSHIHQHEDGPYVKAGVLF